MSSAESLSSQSLLAPVLSAQFLYFVLPLVVGALLYYFPYSPFKYWKNRGVPQIEVKRPFVGDFFDALHKPLNELTWTSYNQHPGEKYIGTYHLTTPTLLLRDPDLVESVLIKDFSVFSERANGDDPNSTLLAKHLLNLSGEHWKNARNKLTPTFSAGKLKGMHSQLVVCCESLIEYMKRLEDGRPFETRNLMARFTMDVISSCAFGLNTDTINDPESKFQEMGMAVFKITTATKCMLFLRPLLPRWFQRVLRWLLPSTNYKSFFTGTVDSTLEYRKKNNVVRPDFLQLLDELRRKDEAHLQPNDPLMFDKNSVYANAFVFFLAGFETTASTMGYALYELALNGDIQEKLRSEVRRVLSKHGGQPSYEAIQDMLYMDQVISETLRKYPPAVSISRRSNRNYQFPGTDLEIPKGMAVTVPIYALHHDPQYFPEPETFNPDRFEGDGSAIRKGTFLPFGDGPRICIGARFARLEIKMCLALLLSKYKIEKCTKTEVPLTFTSKAFLLAPTSGIWLSISQAQ